MGRRLRAPSRPYSLSWAAHTARPPPAAVLACEEGGKCPLSADTRRRRPPGGALIYACTRVARRIPAGLCIFEPPSHRNRGAAQRGSPQAVDGGGCRWKVEYGGRDSGRGAYQALCVVGGREATSHHARNRLASGGALLGVVGSVGEGRGCYSLGGWAPEVDVWSERERREKEETSQISPFWALFLGSPGPGRRVLYLQPYCCGVGGPGWVLWSVGWRGVGVASRI